MNTGVSTVPRRSVRRPRRAWPSVARTSNESIAGLSWRASRALSFVPRQHEQRPVPILDDEEAARAVDADSRRRAEWPHTLSSIPATDPFARRARRFALGVDREADDAMAAGAVAVPGHRELSG